MRVSYILKNIDGVLKANSSASDHTATVTYDPAKTSPEAMSNALSKGGYPVEGAPVFVK